MYVTDFKKIEHYREQWNKLANGNPLLEYEWFNYCALHFHANEHIRIFIIEKDNQLYAAAPLVLVRNGIHSSYKIIGTTELYEPAGLLYKDNDTLALLLKSIVSSGYSAYFQRINSQSSLANYAKELVKNKALVFQRQTSGSCYIQPQGSSWQDFEAKIGKKWRADFRNKLNRAKKSGQVSIDIFTPDIEKTQDEITECIRIESQSWKQQQGSSLSQQEKQQAFFRQYLAIAAQNKTLKICYFRIDDKAIAMHFGIENQQGLWFFKMGYDDTYRRYSPGMQLAHETIKYAFEQKLNTYEFLGAEETWQHAWPVSVHSYQSIIILPYTFSGIIGLLHMGSNIIASRLKRVIGSLFRTKNK